MCKPWSDSPNSREVKNASVASTIRNGGSSFSTASAPLSLTYVGYTDRTATQLDRVYSVLVDQRLPITLAEIKALTGIKSESSIASRIRDIREHGFEVARSNHALASKGARIFQYKMV